MFVLFLMFSFITLLGVLLYYIREFDFKVFPAILLIISFAFNIATAITSINYGKEKGRVQEMAESGRYEIATHNDYSLNELKEFHYINGVYLKEVE